MKNRALAAALVATAAVMSTGCTQPRPPAEFTLVGSFQPAVGCATEWDVSCGETGMTPTDGRHSVELDLPAGGHEFKVTRTGGWEENYGARGARDGDNLALSLPGPAKVRFTYDPAGHVVRAEPPTPAGAELPEDADLAQASLRSALTRERIYFVMTDRFANGDPGNDAGGLAGDRNATGLDPTHKAYYHGGDLRGLTEKLDYVQGLGATAIWITPPLVNKPVQGEGDNASAGYHGYWITDFTQIDPHLGTNEEMRALIDDAHARGIKVYFDIITNHTADVIDYEGGVYDYVSKEASPYRDASGEVFDDADYAGTDTFPEVDPAMTFPYVPTFRTEADATVKVPEWLNDPRLYHNRGDSSFAGESSTYGDFVGLDDLWTERHEVVDGMVEIYSAWADFGIDGFRIDTVKHVNMEFWQEFSPRVLEFARAGNADFFMFGEVFDGDPRFMSQYTTAGELPATIDFGFQGRAIDFAKGAATTGLRDFYAMDDYYTDADSNAYQLPTFTGNHDMGRAAMMLAGAGYSGEDLQDRVELTNALMFLTRGQPVVYYGDEQGLIGAGGDKDARQDLFATAVQQYAEEPVIAAPSGSLDRYDTSHPLYRQIAALAELREEHPALVDGAQIHRYASSGEGIYAFSRVDADEQVEYLVVLNNSTETASASLTTYSSNGTFRAIYGDNGKVRSDKLGRVDVEVPPLSAVVYEGPRLKKPKSAPAVFVTDPSGGIVGGRAEIAAATPDAVFAQVTFAVRPVGTPDWTVLGTDDTAPYRVFHDVSGMPHGTLLEYRAILADSRGNLSVDSSWGRVGDPVADDPGPGPGPIGPITQPDFVSAPGSHNSEMGCPGDWQPDCDQAQLSLDADDLVWKGTYDLPAGDYEFKAAINKSWDENYGAGGVQNGPNIPYTAPGVPVTFYYDHATHWITSDAQSPLLTAPGSYQSELGCPGDWQPDCMRPWLQDPDGDGTWTWSSTEIPAGNYEFKVAHDLAWAESYPTDNVPFSVPSDGVVVTISYVLATHEVSVATSEGGVAADLTAAKAHWLTPGLLAWPADAVPAGAELALLDWRLHWSPDGGLALDAEAVTGGESAPLTYDPAGLPAEVVADHPELADYLALRLDKKVAKDADDILRGQVAVALYDDLGRLKDATGVQIPGVLDELYAEAQDARLGATWQGGKPTLRLWAPTAHDVHLLLWPAGASGDAPVEDARRVDLKRAKDGSWSVKGDRSWAGRNYLYEVEVFAPSTGAVETNLVTDPYSVALTLNSTRSVLVDLADRALQPALWRTAATPALGDEVDQTIYELHVRDFSVSDPDVPAEHRGSYLAFADQGHGIRHLETLAEAGLNTVHLLPTFDIASIPENRWDPSEVTEPACDLESFAPDSPEQQACVKAQAGTDAFNWGYDPWHFLAPEGSYASTAQAAHGGARVAEFRTMVGGLHDAGLRVVLDQVYNHTAQSGQGEKSVLDRVVPGYYHRLNAMGAVETSTCCQNVATEHVMAEKLMVDSVVLWARDYKVDGFRFDLMGHHSRENMEAVRAALDELTVRRDGVDGSAVTLYGEGWDFGEVAGNRLFHQAIQGQLAGTNIGTFNDRLRDAVRGGGPFDEDPRKQGFGSGQFTDPNGAPINGDQTAQQRSLAHDTDLVQIGLAGNLRDFELRSAETGDLVTGEQLDYNGAPAAYAEDPDEVINYVDAHDNETLFDSLTLKLPQATTMQDRVRMNTLSLATVTLGQSPSFWHAGADLLRSKSLDRNSYDSGDWFNLLDFTMADNGFGRGLPPEGDNGSKWDFQRPLLADPALAPAPEDIAAASAMAQDLLELRFSTPLFRLGTAEAIAEKLTFPVSGTDQAHDGVIVMRIDDTAGADVDPALDGLVVVFNASDESVAQELPGLTGANLSLSPVQVDGADEVVKTSTWDAGSGTLSVPARTVAVFVH